MKDSTNIDATASLRALINKKRQQGQTIEPLVLARLGARYCRQSEDTQEYDQASRAVFSRYLEIMPEDDEVRFAYTQLSQTMWRETQVSPWRVFRWFGFAALLVAAGAVAGVIHHYNSPQDLVLPQLSKAPAPVEMSSPESKLEEGPSAQKLEENYSAEPGAPEQEVAEPEVAEPEVAEPEVAEPEVAEPEESPGDLRPITIRAVGDIVIGSSYPSPRLPGSKDMERIKLLQSLFSDTDVVLGNLEAVLLNQGESRKNVKLPGVFSFRMPEDYALVLKKLGFSVLSLANNHALDFGRKGLQSTISNLAKNGIKSVGVPGAKTVFIDVRGASIAFLAYSYLPKLNYMDNLKQVKADIQSAKQKAKLVFVSVHAGKEGNKAAGMPSGKEYFMGEYRGNIKQFAEFAIDAGATAVFGHGPHVVRPYRLYKGKPVFFSLGNFVGYKTLSTRKKLEHSLIADLSFSANGELISAGVIPLKLDKMGIPAVDYSAKNLNSLSSLLNSKLEKSPTLTLSSAKGSANP